MNFMFIKCFNEMQYEINMSASQVTERMKSKTVSSNRLQGFGDEMKGTFTDNTFKVQFALSGNVLVHNSINPVFYGEVTQNNNYSRLSVKMRPNMGSFLMLIIPFIMWIFSVACFVLSVPNIETAFVAATIMFLGFTALVLGTLSNKYYDMKLLIENLFNKDLLCSDKS